VAGKVGFVSLGCPKALVDSELILTQLSAEGYETAKDYSGADLVVVNTCGFIDTAKQESIDTILRYVDAKEAGRLRKFLMEMLEKDPKLRYKSAGELVAALKRVSLAWVPKVEGEKVAAGGAMTIFIAVGAFILVGLGAVIYQTMTRPKPSVKTVVVHDSATPAGSQGSAGKATTAAGDAAAKAGDAAKGMASEGIAKFEATIKDGLAKIPNLDMTKIKFTTEGNTLKVTGDVGSADIRAKIDETLMKANNPLFKIDTTGLLPAAKPAESAPADKPAAK
jgi:hypothetical protein